jgi:hypothetical protein
LSGSFGKGFSHLGVTQFFRILLLRSKDGMTAPLRESELDATQEGVKMNEKINRLTSAATACSEGKTKYVLEDVFWVPISNCSARHFTLPGRPELHSKKPDITEVSSLDESETSASSNPASLVQRPTILSGVRARFAQTRGQARPPSGH